MNKLTLQIKKWLETEANTEYPEITIKNKTDIESGFYYELAINNTKVSLMLKDLKYTPKITWIFYNKLTADEKEYWASRYTFKLDDQDTEYVKSRVYIGKDINKEEVQFIMSREIGTQRIFQKDLRWITTMIRLKKQEVAQ